MEQNRSKGKGMIYMTTSTVRKWGNSLAVRIPQEVSELVKFADGVVIEMIVTDEKELVLRPAAIPVEDLENDQEYLRAHFLRLREMCKQSKGEPEDAIPDLVGDEIWE